MTNFDEIKISVAGQTVVENLSQTLKLKPDDESVMDMMAKSPSRYAYWLRVNVEQMRIVNGIKEEFNHWQITKKNEIRKSLTGKPTETQIKDELAENPEFQARLKILSEESFKLEEIDVAIQAYKHLMDMTRSIGAMKRVELQNFGNQFASISGNSGTIK